MYNSVAEKKFCDFNCYKPNPYNYCACVEERDVFSSYFQMYKSIAV